MFKKLLVPLDGTSQSAVSLPLARTLAQATGGEILLIRIVTPRTASVRDPAKAEARTYLKRVAAELAKDGSRVATIVQRGDSPAADIVREVAAQGADLVVMATHGRGGIERAIFGSVAEGVVAESPVPVLLVRPGGHRTTQLKTLLVPVDWSPGAALALGTAAPLARKTGAKIALVQVVVPATIVYPGPALWADPLWDEDVLASAQRHVNGLAERLQRAGFTAEAHAVVGFVPETIVSTAESLDADLIVMSTHGLRGPMRTMLGSIADEVVRTAHRPVLLVCPRAQSASSQVTDHAVLASVGY
jgi:nucleotide-binding universal stress UspA family protein